MKTLFQNPQSAICTALLEINEGHVQQARVTLGEAIEEAIANGYDPDDAVMFAANWIDLGEIEQAKFLLRKAAWGATP